MSGIAGRGDRRKEKRLPRLPRPDTAASARPSRSLLLRLIPAAAFLAALPTDASLNRAPELNRTVSFLFVGDVFLHSQNIASALD